MSGTTTAFCTSAKAELMQGAHCLAAQVTPTGDTHSNQTIDTLSSIAGIIVGMGIAGAGIPAGAVVSQMLGAASVQSSLAATSTVAADALTISGDGIAMALVKGSPTGTYGAATTNYADLTGNSDEVASGGGYTTGGFAWTAANLTGIATSGTTAYGQESVSPSWTSASFTTVGGVVYNQAARFADVADRSLTVEDFGGSQTVTAGTFTATLPANSSTTALLRAD